MRVVRAESLGMCFGVRDAIALTKQVEQPDRVTIHGELVHNEKVLVQLEERGFHMQSERDRAQKPETDTVLVTAHGVSQKESSRLQAAGLNVIDTTCPLVRKAHDAAQQLADKDCHVILIGRQGHVEVQGIIEDLSSYDVVTTVADVVSWDHLRLGVICQTTTPPRLAAEILEQIESLNPQATVEFRNTICQPTMDRQYALESLCLQVDAVVVVGGQNSNNTRQLVGLAEDCGRPACQVQGPLDLDPDWLERFETVGLTAGTSTLDETVDEIEAAILELTTRDHQPSSH